MSNLSEQPFRILSFDGGGIRGLYSAAFIAHLEKYTGKRLADHFDLIVGTSTGAIIALGLAAGLTAEEILAFYEREGPRIFRRKRRLTQVVRPMYSNQSLLSALQEVFGDRTMNDLDVPVCIAAYELVEATPRVIKTDHSHDLHWGGDRAIWRVAAASAAAPMFFPPVTIDRDDYHIDGGIWANNPVLIGITEAMSRFGKAQADLLVLSVGTCSRPPRLRVRRWHTWGWTTWLWKKRVLEAVFSAQSQSASGVATLMLRDRHRRVDGQLDANIPMDDYALARHLIERGTQAGREQLNPVRDAFLMAPAVRVWNKQGTSE